MLLFNLNCLLQQLMTHVMTEVPTELKVSWWTVVAVRTEAQTGQWDVCFLLWLNDLLSSVVCVMLRSSLEVLNVFKSLKTQVHFNLVWSEPVRQRSSLVLFILFHTWRFHFLMISHVCWWAASDDGFIIISWWWRDISVSGRLIQARFRLSLQQRESWWEITSGSGSDWPKAFPLLLTLCSSTHTKRIFFPDVNWD